MTQSTPMRRIAPGVVILYREPQTDLPLWPSVYLTDEAAPRSFLDTRPHGFFSVVLKLAAVQSVKHLRWAQTSQMIPFDPFAADTATKRSVPGLMNAYDAAIGAKQDNFEMDYWKAVLASTEAPEIISIDDDGDFSSDPDMLRAIELSLQDLQPHRRGQQSSFPVFHPSLSNTEGSFSLSSAGSSKAPMTGSDRSPLIHRPAGSLPRSLTPPSPFSNNNNYSDGFSSSSKRPMPPSDFGSDDEMPSPSQKRKLNGEIRNSGHSDPFQLTSRASYDSRSPTFGLSDEDVCNPAPRSSRPGAAGSYGFSARTSQQTVARTQTSNLAPSAREVFRRNGLKAPAYSAPDEDIMEEEFDESSHFVQVFVGPDADPTTDKDIDPQRRRHKFQLMKRHIWDRLYFRDGVSGRNYFAPIGDNTWELAHPRLADISQDDFKLAAEFLTDGDFGVREPETEDQVAVSFAECVTAWKVAEKLSMDDLFECIVRKMRATRGWWDMFHVMVFACELYDNDLSLDVHNEMKAMLSDAIAEDYDIYIEDDILREQFVTRLKQLPELKRDVHAKIVERIDARLHPQREGAAVLPGHDDEEGDVDLYE